MAVIDDVIEVLTEAMELGDRASDLNVNTLLFGEMPEFDSVTLVIVVTTLEERFDLYVEEDEIDETIFESVGSLTTFVESKLSALQEA